MPGGTLVAPLAAALVRAAEVRGLPRHALLEPLGLTETQLADSEHRVPFTRVVAAWEVAMGRLRDDALPVRVAELASVERYGVLGYTLYTQPTVDAALRALSRYHDVINDSGRWTVVAGPDTTILTWQRDGDGLLGVRVANEQVLASFVTFCRIISQGGIALEWVAFRHLRPRQTRVHEEHFGVPIRWGAAYDAIGVPTSELARTPRGADALVSGYFAAAAEEALARVANASSFTGQVARLVSDALGAGIPTLAVVAARLGVSERTARRRLSDEGSRFEALVVEVQRERAKVLLRGATPLRDVAFALGFADPTAFSRAFRRWTGRSPSDERRAPNGGEEP